MKFIQQKPPISLWEFLEVFPVIAPFFGWVFFCFWQDTILGCFGFSLQRMMTGDLSRFKQIFVFDAGQVVEKGPPEELLIKVHEGVKIVDFW